MTARDLRIAAAQWTATGLLMLPGTAGSSWVAHFTLACAVLLIAGGAVLAWTSVVASREDGGG